VVQLSTAAKTKSPEDEDDSRRLSRRTLGVGEDVTMYVRPQIASASDFSATLGICSNANGEVVYCAPHLPSGDRVSVSAGGVSHSITFNVIKPTGYVTSIHEYNALNLYDGEAGNFYVRLNVRLKPTYVSFAKMQIIELPRVAQDAEGYFAEPSMSYILDHGTHGAGCWLDIDANNSYLDTVSAGTYYVPWGGGGAFTWPIPVAWRVGTEAGVENPLCNMDQRFELDSNGTVRIKKFNRVFERPINGGIQFGEGN
nr:hypothetical protein [Kiritimatiellia bacterium]